MEEPTNQISVRNGVQRKHPTGTNYMLKESKLKTRRNHELESKPTPAKKAVLDIPTQPQSGSRKNKKIAVKKNLENKCTPVIEPVFGKPTQYRGGSTQLESDVKRVKQNNQNLHLCSTDKKQSFIMSESCKFRQINVKPKQFSQTRAKEIKRD